MTRRTRNADGTITLKSFSYFGSGDSDKALQEELTAIEKLNKERLAEWNKLSAEEQAQRVAQWSADSKPSESA